MPKKGSMDMIENEMACVTDVSLLLHKTNAASMDSSDAMEMKPYENL